MLKDRKFIWPLIVLLIATAGLAMALKNSGGTAPPASGGEAVPAAAVRNSTAAQGPDETPAPTPAEEPVVLGGETIPWDTQSLTVDGEKVDAEELEAALASLPMVTQVTVEGKGYSLWERQFLRESWPELHFTWPIRVCGRNVSSDETILSFAGDESLMEADLQEIQELAGEFPDLQTVDLTGCGFPGERLHRLDEDLGDVDVVWTFEIYGVTVCSTDEEIDLSYHAVWDNCAEVEEKIAWMPYLRRVIMEECSVRDSVMAEVNDRHPDVRFIWMVQIKWGGIRTDSTYFIPYREGGAKQYNYNAGVSALQYCPDLVALDLGHGSVKNLDFLDVMPHLKYLILAGIWAKDIVKIGNLKELTWLELFQAGIYDLSPLVGCTSLTDLNICYIPAKGDNVYETLRQMKSLKRIWCCGTLMSDEQIAALQEELPDCEIWHKPGDESTGSTWRYSESYYEMRDAFHMYYMSATGATVGRMTEEELAEIHKEYWGY